MSKSNKTLIIDFQGTPQAVQDIAAVARDLSAVETVKVRSETSGEMIIKPGCAYQEVEAAIHAALRERWPQRYGDQV